MKIIPCRVRQSILVLLILSLVLASASCAGGRQEIVARPSFSAQYIRTNGFHSEVTYPIITVIRSVEALNTYYEQNKDAYALESRSGPVPSDSTIGFLDAIESLDDSFFQKNVLILVLLEESSGSNRHQVQEIIQEEQATRIRIGRKVPPIGTTDMAQWHILIEVEKKAFRDQPITAELFVIE